MKLLVTHRSPDLDAIASLWLFRRFHPEEYADSHLYFVNAGDTIDLRTAADLGFRPEEIVHTDTGLGDFDHHQQDRGRLRICATSLVYEYISGLHPEYRADDALKAIVEYVTAIDHFEEHSWPDAADLKMQCMLHNILDGFKKTRSADDSATAHFGFTCLDAVYAAISEQIQAAAELSTKKKIFHTRFGDAVAIESANDEVIKLAQKQGYALVVRKDPHLGNIRIKAVPGKDIDLTPLSRRIQARDTVGYWYFHPGRTMLLNGSSKDPNRPPSPLTIDEVIAIIQSLD